MLLNKLRKNYRMLKKSNNLSEIMSIVNSNYFHNFIIPILTFLIP